MGVRSPVHIIALGEVLGALAFVRAGPAAPQAYEVSQELERKPERPLATIRQIRLQAPTRQNIIIITKVSNSREVKRSGHSDAIDDSCSVCTMSCESM
jgi:hypothetical protein